MAQVQTTAEYTDSSPRQTFDAFISYATADVRGAVRVQRFLESYRTRPQDARESQLRIFLDRTDIRGGRLRPELRLALEGSRVLIVCCSPATVDSRWVAAEISDYLESRPDGQVAVVLLKGSPESVVPGELRSLDVRMHDLRGGWVLGVLRRKARDELLRLLAFLIGENLRTLINWHRRKRWRNRLSVGISSLVPISLILAVPVDHWQRLDLRDNAGQPILALSAVMDEGKLWLAARVVRGNNTTIDVYPDVLSAPDMKESLGSLSMRGRLLNEQYAPEELSDGLWAALGEQVRNTVEEETAFDPRDDSESERWVGQPASGRYVLFHALHRSRDSKVYVFDGRRTVVGTLTGARPAPAAFVEGEGALPTSDGAAVAWDERYGIWLGVAARRGWSFMGGHGLWFTIDKRSWQKFEGVQNVTSLLIITDRTNPMLLVAEGRRLPAEGGFPRPSQVLAIDLLTRRLRPPPSMPAYTSRSEIEFCGVDGTGVLFVRVDEFIYRHDRITLLQRWLLSE